MKTRYAFTSVGPSLKSETESAAGTANGLPGRPNVMRTRSGIMMARP
jgi:hypothetical protein